jgi:carboxypeptidase D
MVALTISEDIANYIYEHTTRATLDLDLQGIWINDRKPLFNVRLSVPIILSLHTAVIGWQVAQSEIPAVGFVHKYEHVFAFKFVILRLLFPIKFNCVVRHSSRI